MPPYSFTTARFSTVHVSASAAVRTLAASLTAALFRGGQGLGREDGRVNDPILQNMGEIFLPSLHVPEGLHNRARAVARPYNCLRWGAGMDLEGDDPCQPSVSPNLGAKTVYRTRPYPQTPICRYKGLDRFPSAARPRKIHQRRVEMNKGRLEAFSDGVIAIMNTIMVLELKVPHRENLRALSPVLPVFLTYVLSFTY